MTQCKLFLNNCLGDKGQNKGVTAFRLFFLATYLEGAWNWH